MNYPETESKLSPVNKSTPGNSKDCSYPDFKPSSIVNILVSNTTKNFANSKIPSDVIQSSLEYNQFLINRMNELSQKNITKEEHEYIMFKLWENLNNLSCHLDKQLNKCNPSKSKRYCINYKRKPNKKNKHKELIQVINNPKLGIIITIDKSILT